MPGGTVHDDDFTAFVHTVWRPLYRTAYLLLGDHGAAEDLVQTALAKTYAARRARTVEDAGAYVRTVLVNEARSMFRRPSWRREHPVEAVHDGAYEHDPSTRPAVLDALRALPPRQRAVVVLRFYEDLSVARTAEALRCAPGTVKSQTSAALATLRTLLGDDVALLTEGASRD